MPCIGTAILDAPSAGLIRAENVEVWSSAKAKQCSFNRIVRQFSTNSIRQHYTRCAAISLVHHTLAGVVEHYQYVLAVWNVHQLFERCIQIGSCDVCFVKVHIFFCRV